MEKPVAQQSPWWAAYTYVMIWIGAGIIFSFGGEYLITAFLGKSAGAKFLEDPSYIVQHLWVTRLYQCAYTLIVFLLPPFIYCAISKQPPFIFLGLDRVPSPRLLLISMLIVFFSLPFIAYTIELNQKIPMPDDVANLEQKINTATNAMLTMKGPADLIFNLLMFAFLPALGEELCFRGGLQRLLARATKNGHIAILITAFIFSFVHFEFSGFIPRMILAIMFGYMYYWSRNLWLTIFAHFIFNAPQIVAQYFIGAEKLDKMQNSDLFPFAAVVVSAVLMFLAMSWLYRRTMGKWLATLEDTGDA